MNRREVLEHLLAHKKPRQILVDFGGCSLSGADWGVREKLNQFLGFGKCQQEYDERMLEYFDIDTRGVGFIVMPPKPHYQIIKQGELFSDEWGVVRKFTGLYWDIVYSPLKDATVEEVAKYPFPDIDSMDLTTLEQETKRAKELYERTDKIVVSSHCVYGIFELGCWMFGFDDFLYRLAAEEETVHLFFERVVNYQKEVSKIYFDRIGKYCHITTSGDDFATQRSTFCSVPMFDRLIAPYLQERIRFTKQLTDAAFLHHSCGKTISLIPSLERCGVDILNPIQPCCEEMSAANLSKIKTNIVFHGGFDTQDILPNGKPQQIRQHVFELIEQMKAPHIFAAAHNIQDDVPIANIVEMFLATKKYKQLQK